MVRNLLYLLNLLYMVTMDLEKAFHSLDHDFFYYALSKNLTLVISWIKILLNDQQSCVMNGDFATQYFILKRGACQGDPISTYLFLKVLT